jgi:hypothetical protein
MFKDKMNLLGGEFQGLNMNPIPMEFSQQMTTTKWLMALLAKIDEVIGFTNGWYDEIIKDLENDGVLYGKLSAEFLTSFGNEITALQNNITNINTLLEVLSYTAPKVVLTSSPSANVYSFGETINSVMLSFDIVKGSNNLVKAEIYKNGTLLNTITNLLNGVNQFVDGSAINSDTTYYIKVFDDKGNVQSNDIAFKFIYKSWYGKITSSDIVSEALIQGLTNSIFDKNITFNISSLNDEKIIIVSRETLTSVIDSDNFDMLESFTHSTINININNNLTQYNVYVSTNLIKDSNVTLIIEK